MAPLPEVPQKHRREVGIALRGEHAQRMSESPDHQPGDPLLEPEAERRRHRSVEDGDGARRSAEQDGLDQRAMDRRFEAFGMRLRAVHEISAPPPKLKKERKKEEAAKAIDRPKTIWIRRRKPPAVSPKASVSPVVMMMITATILATGPWTESRTF